MIDFRYHFISIIAIFLALGLGIVAGTTVLDRVTVDQLRGNLDRLQTALDNHRKQIRELQAESSHADKLVKALAPRVTAGQLVGLQVLFIGGEDDAGWHATVRDAITSAGATNGGTITLTSKWSLREVEQRDQLRQAFGDRVLGERDPGTDAAKLLGELLLDPAEETVVTNLAEAGFIETAPAEDARQFPPSSAEIVVFASKNDARLAELARGAAGVTPTLVVAPSVEELGAVGVLRRIQDPSQQLSTFDSAGDDSAGVGVVLALRAAVDGHGGDFGRGPGLKFLPPT